MVVAGRLGPLNVLPVYLQVPEAGFATRRSRDSYLREANCHDTAVTKSEKSRCFLSGHFCLLDFMARSRRGGAGCRPVCPTFAACFAVDESFPVEVIMTSRSDSPARPAYPKTSSRRRVEDLKPHPRQADLFRDVSETEITELAARIHRAGMDCPIEILPDGTIIKGHQRLRAVKKLGWTEVDIFVREDLAGDEAETVCELIEDNVVRRQLSKLALARAYRDLDKHQKGRRPGPFAPVRALSPLRRFAVRIGGCSRNAARYLDAAKTPIEVQDALEAGKITLDQASKVAHLAPDKQKAIAEGIRGGEDPRKLVQSYLRRESLARKGGTTSIRSR